MKAVAHRQAADDQFPEGRRPAEILPASYVVPERAAVESKPAELLASIKIVERCSRTPRQAAEGPDRAAFLPPGTRQPFGKFTPNQADFDCLLQTGAQERGFTEDDARLAPGRHSATRKASRLERSRKRPRNAACTQALRLAEHVHKRRIGHQHVSFQNWFLSRPNIVFGPPRVRSWNLGMGDADDVLKGRRARS